MRRIAAIVSALVLLVSSNVGAATASRFPIVKEIRYYAGSVSRVYDDKGPEPWCLEWPYPHADSFGGRIWTPTPNRFDVAGKSIAVFDDESTWTWTGDKQLLIVTEDPSGVDDPVVPTFALRRVAATDCAINVGAPVIGATRTSAGIETICGIGTFLMTELQTAKGPFGLGASGNAQLYACTAGRRTWQVLLIRKGTTALQRQQIATDDQPLELRIRKGLLTISSPFDGSTHIYEWDATHGLVDVQCELFTCEGD